MFRPFNPQGGPAPGGNDPLNTIQREVGRVFDEVVRAFPAMNRGAAATGGFDPKLDVRETERGFEVAAELPGMSEQDVELRLEGDLLTLSGEKTEERTARDGERTHLAERGFGRFHRSFRLPYRPGTDQVQARFDRGVLRVVVPRPQQGQSGERIPINPAGGEA